MEICKEEGCNNPKRTHTDGNLRARCITCQNNMQSYGITGPARTALWEGQGRKCKVCSIAVEFYREGPMDRRACVDHCHETGKIRGVLCSTCNLVLGKVKDNPYRLRELANYLEEADQNG